MKAGDTCAECHRTLANRPFYPFACRHFFHRECLEQAMQAFLDHVSIPSSAPIKKYFPG